MWRVMQATMIGLRCRWWSAVLTLCALSGCGQIQKAGQGQRLCPGGDECDEGQVCRDGECVVEDGGGDTGDDDGGGNSDGGDSGDADGDDCPGVEFPPAPVVPTVVLLIDQGGSMSEAFGGGASTRWDAVREALIGAADDGAVYQLAGRVAFGATLFTSIDGSQGGECPLLRQSPPALNNARAIADLLQDNEPVDDTPTGEAVLAAAANLASGADRSYLVLATDGTPDTCAEPDSDQTPVGRAAAEAAVQEAYDAGVVTLVLSVGDEAAEQHLTRVANAGQGQPLDSGTATPFSALDPAGLVDALEATIGGERSCVIDLDGPVDVERATEGSVVLNSVALEYGTEWQLVDADTMELLGMACDTFVTSDEVTLSAEFPCPG